MLSERRPFCPGSIGLDRPGQASAVIASQGEAGFIEIKIYSKLDGPIFLAVAKAAA